MIIMRIVVRQEELEYLPEGFLSNLFKKITKNNKNSRLMIPEKADNTLEDSFREINSIVSTLNKVIKLSNLSNDYYKGQFPKELRDIIFSKKFSLEKFIESFYKLNDSDKSTVLVTLNSIQRSLRDLKKVMDSNQFSTFLKSEVFLKRKR